MVELHLNLNDSVILCLGMAVAVPKEPLQSGGTYMSLKNLIMELIS